MRYQLILQWPVADYDALEAGENALVDGLDPTHEVDGHDIGSGEMNIFVLTGDPVAAFQSAQRILGALGMWLDARAAFRPVGGSEFTVLWPEGAADFRVV